VPQYQYAGPGGEDPGTGLPVGQAELFCLQGFDAGLPILLSILAPSGNVVDDWLPSLDARNIEECGEKDEPGCSDTANYYFWHPSAAAELGTYKIMARQDDVTASVLSELVNTDQPTITVHPSSAPLGSEFLIGAAGFSPGLTFDLHLYRGNQYHEGESSYVTTLDITIEDDGRGSFLLATIPSDPEGGYMLIREPPLSGGVFWDETDALFNIVADE
jgi:hypothetical protein